MLDVAVGIAYVLKLVATYILVPLLALSVCALLVAGIAGCVYLLKEGGEEDEGGA